MPAEEGRSQIKATKECVSDMNRIFNVGVIGCGQISEAYFRIQKYVNNICIIKCADIDDTASRQCARRYNVKPTTVEDLLGDGEIDAVLNLTNPQSHYQVTKDTLLAGKHAYSEKPMATRVKDGQELLNLATAKQLYLGNAPDTFLGAGVQKTRHLIDTGMVGDVQLGNAFFGFPGVQSFHPNPESWFQANGGGPFIDMGPYYLTALVNLLGPAKEVQGRAYTSAEDRIIGNGPKKGRKIEVESPTTYLLTIEFKNGVLIQLTLSFDVIDHQRNHIELYGTKGSIVVTDPNMFGGSVVLSASVGGSWRRFDTKNMLLGKININKHSGNINEAASNANYRGFGLSEMLYCLEHNRIHRCNGELALHVLDIIECGMAAAISKSVVAIETTCQKPAYLSEKEVGEIMK